MVETPSFSRKLFLVCNYTGLLVISLLCMLPLIHVLAMSLSSSSAVGAGMVNMWPIGFTLESYRFILEKPEFLKSIGITLQRVMLGIPLNMLLTILAAYPLSKDPAQFRWRTLYVWIFVFTMLFNGGIIPIYMTIKTLGLMNSIWALILHHGMPVFNMVILLNFFRSLPKELEEAALMDGAGQWKVLWNIYVPLSVPSLATLTLFATVYQWNAWFDGILFMNSTDRYPLQTYLYTIVVGADALVNNSTDLTVLEAVSDRTARAAQIFLGALPILLVYPFLQRYFIKGIVLGSVKE